MQSQRIKIKASIAKFSYPQADFLGDNNDN